MRLCVETSPSGAMSTSADWQPPSCGCVLKQNMNVDNRNLYRAAAFVRLCVETSLQSGINDQSVAAAFVRLCVETEEHGAMCTVKNAAAFVRLCVETLKLKLGLMNAIAAAFVRLCVETSQN